MKAGLDTILITLFIKDSTGENYIEVGMKKVKECLEKLRYCSNVEEKIIEKEDSNIKKINCCWWFRLSIYCGFTNYIWFSK